METRTVVHFTDTAGFGGAERMILVTLAGLDRARWRPVLAHYPTRGGEELAAAARSIGVHTRVIRGTTGGRGVADLSSFAGVLREESCSVLHAHLVGPLRSTKGLLAGRVARVRGIVATQHLYRPLRPGWERTRQRMVSRLVDRYVAVSHDTARSLAGAVADDRRIVVIQNAIETERFRAHGDLPVAARDGHPIVLAVARLHERKGVRYLLQAAAELPDATFLIAGDGPERENLERMAGELGARDRIRFLGTRADVATLLRDCTVFVLPSLTEGLPVSLIEAMAAGRAVVATDIGGTNEVVVHGETGLLVPPADPAALVIALEHIIRNPDLARRMGEAGRRRVDESFSVRGMVDRLQALYDDVVGADPEEGRR